MKPFQSELKKRESDLLLKLECINKRNEIACHLQLIFDKLSFILDEFPVSQFPDCVHKDEQKLIESFGAYCESIIHQSNWYCRQLDIVTKKLIDESKKN